jgi:hypothetical protein
MAARRRWGLGCGRLGVAGIAVLGLLALAIAGVALVSSRGAATAPRPADRVQSAGMPSRLRSLSPQAQSQISTALGSGRSGYAAQPAGGGWRLAGGGLHARLGRTASTVGADGGSVSLSLSGLGRGTIRHSLRDGVAPIAAGNRVVYRARGLAEWFAAGPLGLEQGFTISHRPAGSRRALTVAMRVAGSLRAMATGAQVEFVTRSGAVALRYGGLAATDATGRRLPAALVLRGNSLLLRITDRGARYPVQIDPFFQQGSKLVGDGASAADFGTSLGLSANGTTAVIGAPGDNGGAGAAWLFTSSDGLWSAGKKIIGNCTSSCANQGTGETSSSGAFGESVAVSGDGSTVLVAAPFDDSGDGAAWVFTQSGGAWTQQARLVADCTSSCADRGAGETGHGNLGTSAALDTTGDVALLGADNDSSGQGAAWAYARNNGTWTQRGAQLTGTCSDTCAGFGDSVALSGTGATALVGGGADNSGAGGAWVFGVTVGQVGLNYVQDGNELTGDCAANGDLCANRGRGETGAGQFRSLHPAVASAGRRPDARAGWSGRPKPTSPGCVGPGHPAAADGRVTKPLPAGALRDRAGRMHQPAPERDVPADGHPAAFGLHRIDGGYPGAFARQPGGSGPDTADHPHRTSWRPANDHHPGDGRLLRPQRERGDERRNGESRSDR